MQGRFDDLPEQAFFMVGGLDEAAQQAKQMAGHTEAGAATP